MKLIKKYIERKKNRKKDGRTERKKNLEQKERTKTKGDIK